MNEKYWHKKSQQKQSIFKTVIPEQNHKRWYKESKLFWFEFNYLELTEYITKGLVLICAK